MTDENPQPENQENTGAHTPGLREMGEIVRDLAVGGAGIGVLPVMALTGLLTAAGAVSELAHGRPGKAAAMGTAGVTLIGLAAWGGRKLWNHFYGAAQPEATAETAKREQKNPEPAAVGAAVPSPAPLSPK